MFVADPDSKFQQLISVSQAQHSQVEENGGIYWCKTRPNLCLQVCLDGQGVDHSGMPKLSHQRMSSNADRDAFSLNFVGEIANAARVARPAADVIETNLERPSTCHDIE